MIRRTATIAALCALALALAAPCVLAGEGKTYGKDLTGTEVVKISELIANPDKYVGKTVRAEGLITDVCPKRGCWLMLAGDKEFQTVRVKAEDGVIVFPMSIKGKHATAEGVFTKIDLTKEQAIEHAKHLAEEKGEPFDAEKAKDIPTVVYQIQVTGAVVR